MNIIIKKAFEGKKALKPLPEFERYNSLQMERIIHSFFDETSPLKINDSLARKIPMIKMVDYILREAGGTIELTSSGYLPPKLVKDLYAKKYISEDCIDCGIVKLRTELDSMSVSLARILARLSGAIIRKKNTLYLTSDGVCCLDDAGELFRKIIKAFFYKFNWPYYDVYGDNSVGQFGAGFSMVLLKKYGKDFQSDKFYAEKYFKAFPELFVKSMLDWQHAINCYSVRTFDRFMYFFGFIEIKREKIQWNTDKFIKKTALFDKLIKFDRKAIY